MKYQYLWEKLTENNINLNINELDPELQAYLRNTTNNLANHYGDDAKFVFLERKSNDVLVVDLANVNSNEVTLFKAMNCSGGYGTDILGSELDKLADMVSNFIKTSFPTTDEFHSYDRYLLVNSILKLISKHTNTTSNDWEITFTSTGTEAIDLAMQLIMLDGYSLQNNINAKKEKDVIFACHGAWHGWGLNSNQLLDRKQFTGGIPRISNDYKVVFIHYNNIENLRKKFSLYKGRIKSIVVEGILGDGGVIVGDDVWWEELFKLASEENATILDDEIFTGFRCGGVLAIPKGFSPDCITIGKALGGSLFPISAVIWKKNKFNIRPGIGVRTFNARPFQAKIVNEIIQTIIDNNLFQRSEDLGNYFYQKLNILIQNDNYLFKEVRGKGLFIGLELSRKFAKKGRIIRDILLRNGILVEVESGQLGLHIDREYRIHETIRIAPPLTISKSDIDYIVEQIKKTIKTLKD